MKRLRDKVMQLSARDDLGNEELIEVLSSITTLAFYSRIRTFNFANNLIQSIALIGTLNPDRIQLTAGGLISVGLHLIPTVILNLKF
jgi:hypothetical protein